MNANPLHWFSHAGPDTRSRFANRREAGRQLAAAVKALDLSDPVVLALPRGGVPVGYEVAQALGAPLDILLVRKIGAPGHAEYGIGAIVDGPAPQVVIDRAAARRAGASPSYIDHAVARERAEIERRRAVYCKAPSRPIAGRSVVLVDDGIATGGTVRAALAALSAVTVADRPARVVLAVPVAPRDVLTRLSPLCDDVVCLVVPDPFYAVGEHYVDFTQTDDAEVVALLQG